MKPVDQRLKRLTETDLCQAEVAEEYKQELKRMAQNPADIKAAKKNSKLFKALADEKRLRIIKLLATQEMCICELMIALDMTQPNLSHHIQILENAGVVNRTKKGKWVYCAVANKELVESLSRLNLL